MDDTNTNSNDIDVIIRSSTAKVGGGWGKYKRLAIMVVDKGATPYGITDHAQGVRSIHHETDALNVGKTSKCAYAKALVYLRGVADEMAAELGAGPVRVVS